MAGDGAGETGHGGRETKCWFTTPYSPNQPYDPNSPYLPKLFRLTRIPFPAPRPPLSRAPFPAPRVSPLNQ